ncbi:mRNA decapping complex subunit 2 [Smittium mucronatum]|uniref:mRNA decapping complex subunit 2 n=1 Tax=Smittium mucronatum TaxID=133383 RepID=A0A1R0H1F1_9FUNG|nr:mRNA decapping complex subunit 2 [Smittium mucronatum]
MTAIVYNSIHDALDDLSIRFIINVPEEELGSVERIFFQIEESHWFYEDFIVEQNPHLPSMSLKNFASCMLQHCPLLSKWSMNASEVYRSFLEYKFKVPVLLVKGWSSSSSWGFPQGKINKDESEFECAKREVLEEIGYDISAHASETLWIERKVTEHRTRLYYVVGIPESTVFKTKTRKEISEIKWHNIKDLIKPKARNNDSKNANPGGSKNNKLFLIRPFIQ